jgi:hypothetical protein
VPLVMGDDYAVDLQRVERGRTLALRSAVDTDKAERLVDTSNDKRLQ